MRKHININELETSFNYMLKEIRLCFCEFTPKALRLKQHLKHLTSDIDFVKNLSFSFKQDIEQLKFQYPIPDHINHNVNADIYDLEIRLVNLAKYSNKNEILYNWFTRFAETKNYIVENSTKQYMSNNHVSDEDSKLNIPEVDTKVIKFNHLL